MREEDVNVDELSYELRRHALLRGREKKQT